MGFYNEILKSYKNLFGSAKGGETRSVSYLSLFTYADLKDKLFTLFGVIAASGNGVLMPLIFVLYGNATDAFVQTSFCFLLDYNISTFCPPEVNEGNINDLYYKCNLSFLNVTIPGKNLVNTVKTQGIYMTIVGFATWVLSWMQIAFLTLSAESQTLKLRKRLFHSIIYKDVQWFDTHSAGSINSYLVQNANKYKNGVGDKIGLIFQAVITAIASIILGLAKGWKLTLVILATSPILMLSSALMTKVSTRSTNMETKAYAKAGSVAQEALSNIRTVHSFNGISKMEEKYEILLNDAKREGMKKGISNGLMMGILWIVIFFVYALGFWYGGKLNRDEGQSIGVVLIVFLGVQNSIFTLGNAAPHYHSVVEAKAATHDLYDIIAEPSQIESPQCDISRSEKRKQSQRASSENSVSTRVIEFKNIKFSYPCRPDVMVLNNFNLKINEGQTVALVGESGSGKSTIVQLLLRFYDPSEGCIILDGRDIRTLELSTLRKNIGLVSQEPVLFSTTIAENIRLGNENITDDQIENACKKANAHEFIKKLPDKYETFVGESGTQLSGGQKQRIAIARALIHDPKILLLDEATSALDNESEKYVQEALEIASKGRTTIVIAHRLSTVRNADVIVSMDKGAAFEYGTHEELMEKCGLYFKLFNMQSRRHDTYGAQAFDMKKGRTHTQKSLAKETEDIIDDEKEDEASMSSLLYVMKKNSPEVIFILIGCFCCIIWGIIQTLYEFYFAKFVTSFSHCNIVERQKSINLCCVVYIVFGIVSFCTQLATGYAFAISGERLTKRLRLQLFNSILRQDIAFFDKDENNVGTLCTMLSTEASAVQGVTGIRIGVILSNLAILGIAILIAFIFGWELCLVIIAFIPFLILGGVLSTKLIAGFTAKDKKLLEKAGKVVMEVSANVRTVKQLRKEEYFFMKYSDIVTEAYYKTKNKCLITGFLYGLSQAIVNFAIAAGYYAGAEFIMKGRMSTEEMMFVFGCLVFGAMSVGQNQAMAPDFGKARAAAAKLHKIIELQPTIDSLSTDGLKLSDVKGEITFKNVKFEYPSRPGVPVLCDIDINIGSGCSVAFVGSSGCGKSTAIQLLQRFYDPNDGEIELDNDSIEKMNIHWYRKQLGVVGQEPALFNWSIAENIAFGDTSREVNMHEIKAACKISNIDSFIENLPNGYDTLVGAKGTLISGGQKQRIAIARALIRNPKILLLDEATSALDTESEIVVQEALDRAQKNRTCISIAHRLSTIVHCNEIFVFKDGVIIERGTHEELLAKKGVYYDLYALSAH